MEELSPYAQIHEIIETKAPFDQLWRTIVSFSTSQDKWLNGPILSLNAEEIDEQVKSFFDIVSLLLMLVETVYSS